MQKSMYTGSKIARSLCCYNVIHYPSIMFLIVNNFFLHALVMWIFPILDPNNVTVELTETLMLQFNYHELDIEENFTTVGWIDEGTCNTYMLQGYTLTSIRNGELRMPEYIITIVDEYTATIPSDEYSAGDVILYRLISVDENGTICSGQRSKATFYRFDGM